MFVFPNEALQIREQRPRRQWLTSAGTSIISDLHAIICVFTYGTPGSIIDYSVRHTESLFCYWVGKAGKRYDANHKHWQGVLGYYMGPMGNLL